MEQQERNNNSITGKKIKRSSVAGITLGFALSAVGVIFGGKLVVEEVARTNHPQAKQVDDRSQGQSSEAASIAWNIYYDIDHVAFCSWVITEFNVVGEAVCAESKSLKGTSKISHNRAPTTPKTPSL